MEVIHQSLEQHTLQSTVEDLPNEILEFIFGFLPPYRDLQNCMIVSKRWYSCGQSVLRKASYKLIKAIGEFNILWKNVAPIEMTPTITRRFSHSACVLENNMYIFGGCTTNATSFNDLWRFDLSKRQWIRPVATGTYPVPKAYTTMVNYKNYLIVFGGWTYPSSSQYYQNVTMFNEIHFYCVKTNKWTLVNSHNSPPPMAGHSACIKGDEMVVIGGLVMSAAQNYQIQCSNEVWVLNIPTSTWRRQETTKLKPYPRYSHSIVSLDYERLLVIGGVQTLQNRFVYSDCWMLTMVGPVWTWKELAVRNKEWAASNIWCNPACRVGDKVVSLSRSRNGWNSAKPLVTSAVRLSGLGRPIGAPVSVRVEQNLQRPLDRDQNINGKRGVLPRQGNAARHAQLNAINEPIVPSPELIVNSSSSTNADEENASSRNNLSTPRPEGNFPIGSGSSSNSSDQSFNLNNSSNAHSIGNSSSPTPGTSTDSNYSIPGPSFEGLIPGPPVSSSDLNTENPENSSESSNSIPGPSGLDSARSDLRRKVKNKGIKIARQLQEANRFRMAAFACEAPRNFPPVPELINQRQIAHLEDRREPDLPPECNQQRPPAIKKIKRNTLTMHVLDISSIMNGNSLNYVSWLCPRLGEMDGAPEELVMYSLVKGNGELIMFGGVHNDINFFNYTEQQSLYSNSLHFITAPRDMI